MGTNSCRAALRNFAALHIDEDCTSIKGTHDNELFFNCIFEQLSGLTLRNCDLNQSKFITNSIRDALGFTLTLDCHSADNVEYSPLLFKLFLVLLYKTKGNDEMREKLPSVIGKDEMEKFLRILKRVE